MALSTLLAGGLRLFCPYEEVETIEVVTPGGGYTAGQIVKIQGVIGVAYKTYTAGQTAVLIVKAPDVEVTCAAASGTDYAVGAPVYYDAAAAEVNESSADNDFCGVVMVQPAATAEKVRIKLDGTINNTQDVMLSTALFAAASIAGCVFVAPFACSLVRASANWGTAAGQPGTAVLEKVASAGAAGTGDVCTATAFDLAGTADTPQTLEAVSDGKEVMAKGDRLHLKLASGAATSLASGVLTLEIKRK